MICSLIRNKGANVATVRVLSGPERRRRWTTAEKLRIAEEGLALGANVVEVARRHDVRRSLVTAWRGRRA
ncbi:transposase [Bradyrhizobium sp. RDT46]|uniref:transposase n=1 Tax=Bradyrhizobium sp. RDT46 TaxID=3341829 RepID=UPI0035C6F05C